MGQGQSQRAIKVITDSLLQGNWVVIENCHVDAAWVHELEIICLNVATSENINEEFRLWLTSHPVDHFPITVLQMSLKITIESAHGLKAIATQLFTTQPWLEESSFPSSFTGLAEQLWHRSIFALVFFHAVVQERVAFGPIGWNVPYEFNEADLDISMEQLKMFLTTYETIPMDGHSALIKDCNYGGRVTDAKDQLLLNTILDEIYNQNVVNEEGYEFVAFGGIRVPAVPTSLNNLVAVSKLSIRTSPATVGLNECAVFGSNCLEASDVRRRTIRLALRFCKYKLCFLIAASLRHSSNPNGITGHYKIQHCHSR